MSKRFSIKTVGYSKGSCSENGPHRIFTPLKKRQLEGLVICHSELNRVDFSHADLREAAFHSVSLAAADFSGADLGNTSFIECDLRQARFERAVISNTRFDRSWLIGAHSLSEEMSEYARRHSGRLWFS